MSDLNVNDGKGLYDSEGMFDLLVSDLNNLVKDLMNGQNVLFCNRVSGMAQKLVNLKSGIKNDMDAMRKKVEELKAANDSLMEQITGLQVEKDGAENGSN